MRTTGVEGYIEALGCAALGRAELVDILKYYEVCHSAEKYTFSMLGPCRVTLVPNRLEVAGRDEPV
jgi:hypothetical protein